MSVTTWALVALIVAVLFVGGRIASALEQINAELVAYLDAITGSVGDIKNDVSEIAWGETDKRIGKERGEH